MTDFDTLLSSYTTKGNPTVHGAFFTCVDKHGKTIYKKISGYDSLLPTASPLREDAVIKAASASKLFTSIALLQCVDKGLLTLDEPISRILPEIGSQEIISADENGELKYTKSETKITARMLLSHASGFAYFFLHPLLLKWHATRPNKGSNIITEKYDSPLIFEPGTGWFYGGGLDWAGVAVRRLHDSIPLEEYMIQHVWKPLGLSAPYPTFNISDSSKSEYKARLMGAAERTEDGGLKEHEFWHGQNSDGEGGAGLCLTAKEYIAVLADLISDEPKLLKKETVEEMWRPQIPKGSAGIPMLMSLKVAWSMVAGPVEGDDVNHGLGGLLAQGEAKELGQPRNVLCWGGGSGTVWWACRERGVAGMMFTQLHPFTDPKVAELVNAWKKDFWSGYDKS